MMIRDRDTAVALNWAARARRCGPRPRGHDYRSGVVMRHAGRTVTMSSRFRPYAIGHGGDARARHIVRAVYVCWYRGRVADLLVVGWCGIKLSTAVLVDEGTRAAYECPTCVFQRVLPR